MRSTWWAKFLVALASALGLIVIGLPTPSHAATASSQLDRRYFSAVYGNLTTTGTWLRKLRYTFNPKSPTAGTVTVSYQQWNGANALTTQRSQVSSTPCNGVAACSIFRTSPNSTGTLTGTYVFIGVAGTATTPAPRNVGTLVIYLTNPAVKEVWKLTPKDNNTFTRMDLAGSTAATDRPNNGRGYGSKVPFSTYASAAAVDQVTTFFRGIAKGMNATNTHLDTTWQLPVNQFTRPNASATTLGLSYAYPLTDTCGRGTNYPGTIYTMAVTQREVYVNNWRRCLARKATGSYSGGVHVTAADQILNDQGTFVGFVGVEADNSGGWTLQMADSLVYGIYNAEGLR